ncbi:response regulator transcription factor [Bariatricus massiliensis]|uniref:Stage 0 sporulation protein A homolog n=1 Tax=Bariatricus massiliensis TaxID=1745713 RepID=A0ABS8DHD0_9FIRM|nr:response regulator transcription factor [Bariatricus massiliensis]MCB7304463.1 response regulator transcription factor [Bariatricus massiliensis]MCB7375115.1 response regulator transcription factor [Bariatricus massiliensis]MCB7387574.1 response regulator transcription factor [Bariatricus massiliensis]MCB7411735.1 response regulator transcription factor [Bariatricus massiliensis]MCQ5253871.1 response regulator transcription factor [Bariatricus massiliensis]
MIKILIVEDEKPISDLIKMSLTDEGYHCVCAYDGQEAADIIEKQVFDLILLDIMLPKIDGYELLEYINYYHTPVIFLTARAEVKDRVKGLKAGAEDYITKPFEIMELLARVETVLRRYNKTSKEIGFGDIKIDTEAHIVTKAGNPVGLTAKEFALLVLLVRNKNKALYRSQIYAQVWEEEYLGDSRTVDLHIQRLRKKLSLEKSIVPVYKIGYRLEVED